MFNNQISILIFSLQQYKYLHITIDMVLEWIEILIKLSVMQIIF